MAKEVSKKQKNSVTLASLHTWNMWLAAIHAASGMLVILLSATKLFPIHTTYLTLDPVGSEIAGHPILAGVTRHLFDINMAYLVAAFFFLSALAHAFVATLYRKTYESDLRRGINKIRWSEYALTAGIMMVAIALLSGVADLSTLILIFALILVMNLMGLAMELYNSGKSKPDWLAYAAGCVAGIVPWIVVALYLWGAGVYGSGTIPVFVYWIFGSLLVLFSSFAFNMYLQYRRIGRWRDYLYGERVYMVLSLVAKTALAWQVFVGALRP